MTRPLLLDLFCGAGGAAMGYHRAGFDVVGVDIAPQPHYPFEFHQADALAMVRDRLIGCWHEDYSRSALPGMLNACLGQFDVIHASPPCQAYSTMGNRSRAENKRRLPPSPDLLGSVLTMMAEITLPWIVENVGGAKTLMPNAFVLSGGMFGLGVHRPRYFCSNVLVLTPTPVPAPAHGLGVYGRAPDGRRLWNRKSNGTYRAPRSLEEAQEAMGMDWADWHGTKEAIPPAYTEFIGAQLLAHLGASA